MDEEKRLDERLEENGQPEGIEQPEAVIDAPPDELWEGDDWIGEIEDKVKGFRDAMTDVAREADEGMIDGPLGKVLVFLKRYWAVVLIALIPFVPKLIDHWADHNPFPAVPELITEAELQEISDYIVQWDAASKWNMNWMHYIDRDGDGTRDMAVHAFACPEEREEMYIRTSLELPSLWQVITGKHPLAPAAEEMAFQDGRVCLIITVNGPTAGDRSELRFAVEEALTAIRREASGEAPPQEPDPDFVDFMERIDQILENQTQEEGV